MKSVKPSTPFLLLGIAVFGLVAVTIGEPNTDESSAKPRVDGGSDKGVRCIPVWKDWQRDIATFDARLRKLVETASIPKEEEFRRRLESESGWVEVITDGYGGVVDFNAAKGTIQYEASELIGSGGPCIDWEFELASDAKASYDKSMQFTPDLATIANGGEEKSGQVGFSISIAEMDDVAFKAGERIRLRAAIDDFSRFKKRYSKATGLVVIYYLEESPNPLFNLRLDKADVTRLESNAGEQGGPGRPATRSESDPEGGDKPQAGSEGRPPAGGAGPQR